MMIIMSCWTRESYSNNLWLTCNISKRLSTVLEQRRFHIIWDIIANIWNWKDLMCKHSWFLLATLIGAERRPDCWADQKEQRQAPEERWGGDEKGWVKRMSFFKMCRKCHHDHLCHHDEIGARSGWCKVKVWRGNNKDGLDKLEYWEWPIDERC